MCHDGVSVTGRIVNRGSPLQQDTLDFLAPLLGEYPCHVASEHRGGQGRQAFGGGLYVRYPRVRGYPELRDNTPVPSARIGARRYPELVSERLAVAVRRVAENWLAAPEVLDRVPGVHVCFHRDEGRCSPRRLAPARGQHQFALRVHGGDRAGGRIEYDVIAERRAHARRRHTELGAEQFAAGRRRDVMTGNARIGPCGRADHPPLRTLRIATLDGGNRAQYRGPCGKPSQPSPRSAQGAPDAVHTLLVRSKSTSRWSGSSSIFTTFFFTNEYRRM